MFTGLIQETGSVAKIESLSTLKKIRISSEKISHEAEIGDSISCNGVCLTVKEKTKGILIFDATEHTVKISNLSFLKIRDVVNLESSLKANDKLGGHFVYGHVDAVLRVKRIVKKGGYYEFVFTLPFEFKHLVFPQASVALDGISLTVSNCATDSFSVNVIPHTFQNTNLSKRRVQDRVNVEFDYLIKSVMAVSGKKV